MGPMAFSLMRATHRRWPAHFGYSGHGTWMNDNYRPDLYLASTESVTPEQTEALAAALDTAAIVVCTDSAVIPRLIRDQVPDTRQFRIVLDTKNKIKKNMFLRWLGEFNNQWQRANENRHSIDFYQNLWQQLCSHFHADAPSDRGRAIVDQASHSGIHDWLSAVQQEFALGDADIDSEEYDKYLRWLYSMTVSPAPAFPDHYSWFLGIADAILQQTAMDLPYQEVLDQDQQRQFRDLMDFFAYKRDFFRFSPGIFERLSIPYVQHFPPKTKP